MTTESTSRPRGVSEMATKMEIFNQIFKGTSILNSIDAQKAVMRKRHDAVNEIYDYWQNSDKTSADFNFVKTLLLL